MLLESELLLVVERVLRGRDRDQREVRRESVRRWWSECFGAGTGTNGKSGVNRFAGTVVRVIPQQRRLWLRCRHWCLWCALRGARGWHGRLLGCRRHRHISHCHLLRCCSAVLLTGDSRCGGVQVSPVGVCLADLTVNLSPSTRPRHLPSLALRWELCSPLRVATWVVRGCSVQVRDRR